MPPFVVGLPIPPDLMGQNKITGIDAAFHSQGKLLHMEVKDCRSRNSSS